MSEQAELRLQALLRRDPRDEAALFALAKLRLVNGDSAQAAELAARAVALNRTRADYLSVQGIAECECGRMDRGLALLKRAVKMTPAQAAAHFNLAKAQEKAGLIDAAVASYRRASALDARSTQAQLNLASLLVRRGDVEAALAALRDAQGRTPDSGEIAAALAAVLMFADGGPAAAAAHLRAFLDRRPDDPAVRSALATLLLGSGDWAAGWSAYRWRVRRPDIPPPTLPELCAPAAGRVPVLVHEQGIGDTLFFLRYLPLLVERGLRPLALVPDRMLPLLSRSAFGAHVQSEASFTDAGSAVHERFLIGDAPWLSGLTTPVPSLRLDAEPQRVREWREALAALGPPPYLGVAWRAGVAPREFGYDRRSLAKHLPPAALGAAVRGHGATLISLQRDPNADEMEQLRSSAACAVHDLSAATEDLASLLALLAALDSYAGVSSTNVHLRAAVGGGGHVFVPFPPEWRWMQAGDRSPWFPDIRVHRQTHRGDWGPALAGAREALSAGLRGRAPG